MPGILCFEKLGPGSEGEHLQVSPWSLTNTEDMFSIGAITCEMLTGWHPFYTPNVDDAQSVQAWHSDCGDVGSWGSQT